jgi:hypothetical protein
MRTECSVRLAAGAAWQHAPWAALHGGPAARRVQDAAAAAAEAAEAGAAPDAGVPVPFEELVAGAEPGPGEAPDLSAALRRIKEVARVLGSFAALRDPARPRADYVDQVPSRQPQAPTAVALPYPTIILP